MHLEEPHPHLYIVRSLPEWTELENLSYFGRKPPIVVNFLYTDLLSAKYL